MKKLTIQDIKEHFSYCIDEGLAIGEQEEILLHSLYKKAEKMEEQQKEIEGLHWRNEWIKSQEEIGHLGASVHDLKQENARLRKALEKTKDIVHVIGCPHCSDAEAIVSQAIKE